MTDGKNYRLNRQNLLFGPSPHTTQDRGNQSGENKNTLLIDKNNS